MVGKARQAPTARVALARLIISRRQTQGLTLEGLADATGATVERLRSAEAPGTILPTGRLVAAVDAALGADGTILAAWTMAGGDKQ